MRPSRPQMCYWPGRRGSVSALANRRSRRRRRYTSSRPPQSSSSLSDTRGKRTLPQASRSQPSMESRSTACLQSSCTFRRCTWCSAWNCSTSRAGRSIAGCCRIPTRKSWADRCTMPATAQPFRLSTSNSQGMRYIFRSSHCKNSRRRNYCMTTRQPWTSSLTSRRGTSILASAHTFRSGTACTWPRSEWTRSPRRTECIPWRLHTCLQRRRTGGRRERKAP